MSESLIALAAAAASVAAVLITLAQWFSAARAARRQRDVEMLRWGHDVIDLMAEVEVASFSVSSKETHSPREIEHLGTRASALVDKGRLFFPNVPFKPRRRMLGLLPPKHIKSAALRRARATGWRVQILDEVLKVFYVAQHLAVGERLDRETLRAHVWDARREFLALLQREMGRSLQRTSREKAGAGVPGDPALWDAPRRDVKLRRRIVE